jgi:HEAT repeat protein
MFSVSTLYYPAAVRRRHIIALFWITGVVGIGLAILLRGPSEPAYRGRTLSDWIVTTRVHPDDDDARMAVRHLASNSIPLLLDWIKREDRPTVRARIAQAKDRAFAFLEGHRVIRPRSHSGFMDWKGSYRSLARTALSDLGPEAKSAVPALIQMLGTKGPTTNDFSPIAGTAYLLLPKMAPASIPPLIDALSSSDLQVYALAAGVLGEIGPQASVAIPVIHKRLADTNVMIRVGAAEILGKLGADPTVFMPTVVESLLDPDYTFLDYKLEVLLKYKDHARAALPILMNIQTNAASLGSPTNQYVRQQATGALLQLQSTGDAGP